MWFRLVGWVVLFVFVFWFDYVWFVRVAVYNSVVCGFVLAFWILFIYFILFWVGFGLVGYGFYMVLFIVCFVIDLLISIFVVAGVVCM